MLQYIRSLQFFVLVTKLDSFVQLISKVIKLFSPMADSRLRRLVVGFSMLRSGFHPRQFKKICLCFFSKWHFLQFPFLYACFRFQLYVPCQYHSISASFTHHGRYTVLTFNSSFIRQSQVFFSLHLIKTKAPVTKEACKCFIESSFTISKERTAKYKSLLITIQSRIPLEKLILIQLGKNFPNLMEIQGWLAYL
jgi:hypothetical protein